MPQQSLKYFLLHLLPLSEGFVFFELFSGLGRVIRRVLGYQVRVRVNAVLFSIQEPGQVVVGPFSRRHSSLS
jgi:hypothetical protein